MVNGAGNQIDAARWSRGGGQGGATPNTVYWITEGRLGTNQNVETSHRITRSGRNSPPGAANGVARSPGDLGEIVTKWQGNELWQVYPTVSHSNDASS